MNTIAALVCAKFDSVGLHYKTDELEGRTVITCGMNAEVTTVTVRMFIDDEDTHVALRSFGVVKANQDKYADILMLCNDLNNEYRWVKFSIDGDGDTNVAIDAIVSEENAGDVIVELFIRMVQIVKDVYPRFMKALWA